jgi:hypothetical protein
MMDDDDMIVIIREVRTSFVLLIGMELGFGVLDDNMFGLLCPGQSRGSRRLLGRTLGHHGDD